MYARKTHLSCFVEQLETLLRFEETRCKVRVSVTFPGILRVVDEFPAQNYQSFDLGNKVVAAAIDIHFDEFLSLNSVLRVND